MIQIGIDFGGTKIEAAALDPSGAFLSRLRTPNPGGYEQAIRAVRDLIQGVEQESGRKGTVGIGAPGSPSPRDGMMRNANATFLNGRPFQSDLEAALGRPIRLANDANCMALSEAFDGAAGGARSAFGVIVGTGVGGGLVVDGRIVEGANGMGGELGHVPLPWMTQDEFPGPACWCGKRGCLDVLVSGTGVRLDHERRTGVAMDPPLIVEAARAGEPDAVSTLDAYISRLGRALAMIANIVDPDVFVLGGGMSNVDEIYDLLPPVIAQYAFGGLWQGRVVKARWGDSSGVRGAARLWS
ncbi:fructokinase [Brevundimonas intermedia]|uniref:Fructokinase n=1 Tax=Brevundimonas intermedia TaxID=74315 RepID=A0ABQ5TG35_9CAUL|nr:ROK family protein [Brevundimonas intermedia]GLK50008.1 fructokinase [Brevundimonas intermedia]